jgi:hypothetical protein
MTSVFWHVGGIIPVGYMSHKTAITISVYATVRRNVEEALKEKPGRKLPRSVLLLHEKISCTQVRKGTAAGS